MSDIFPGGGETGALIRSMDWAKTPLGPVEDWPMTLKGLVRAMLDARQPMIVWWGPELIQLYNDAMRDKHPTGMGQPGREAWKQAWLAVGHELQRVLDEGVSIWNEDMYVPVDRNGRIEDAWWTYNYSPVHDDDGKRAGILIICTETTAGVVARKQLEQARREAELARAELHSAFMQAPNPIAILSGADQVFTFANPAYERFVVREVMGLRLNQAFTDAEVSQYSPLIDRVYRTGEPMELHNSEMQLANADGSIRTLYMDVSYHPVRGIDGQITGVLAGVVDVTTNVMARIEAERRQQERAAAFEREAELRAQAEEANRQRDEVIGSVGAGIWALDVASGKIEADARSRELQGIADDMELTRASGLDTMENRDQIDLTIEAALRGENGGRYNVEYRTGGPNSPSRWVESRAQALFDQDGAAYKLVGVNLDITARKQAEIERDELSRRLKANEALLRTIMDALPVLVSFVDADERYAFVNRCYEQWFGVTREQLVGRTLLEVVGAAAYAKLGPSVKRALSGETFTQEQLDVPYRLGGNRDVRVSFVSLRDASGRPNGYVTMLQDITLETRSQKEREALLKRVEAARADAEAVRARLDQFVQEAPAAMGFVRGPNHVFEMVNPRYQELMGRNRQLLGRPMAEAAPEVISQGFIQLFDAVYQTGHPFFAEGVPAQLDRNGDGNLEEVFFNLAFQPARDGFDNQIIGIDIYGFDVTSQVRLRQREEELKLLAEERRATEEQLLGIVSHDLRSPLGAIVLAASMLARRTDLDDRASKTVLRITSSAERATRLVKDLLDFTQARLGKGIPVYPRLENLSMLAEVWVEEWRSASPDRQIRLSAQGDGTTLVDPERMAQVFSNLVANAVKYSAPNSVVSIRIRGTDDEIVGEVHNEGAPIPDSDRTRMFQPLERGEGRRDMDTRSVGLGLFIVKSVVLAHGGTVDVTSTAESGTTFSVALPRRSA